jgi:hypothetical protein
MAGNPDDAALAESDDADVSPLLARLKEALAPTNGTDAKHGNELQRLFPLDKWRSLARHFNVQGRTTREGRTLGPISAAVISCFKQRQLNTLPALPEPDDAPVAPAPPVIVDATAIVAAAIAVAAGHLHDAGGGADVDVDVDVNVDANAYANADDDADDDADSGAGAGAGAGAGLVVPKTAKAAKVKLLTRDELSAELKKWWYATRSMLYRHIAPALLCDASTSLSFFLFICSAQASVDTSQERLHQKPQNPPHWPLAA